MGQAGISSVTPIFRTPVIWVTALPLGMPVMITGNSYRVFKVSVCHARPEVAGHVAHEVRGAILASEERLLVDGPLLLVQAAAA